MGAKLKHVKDAQEVNIHSMPCKIYGDVDVNIQPFFKPTSTSENELKASFRGYPLDGTVIELPDGYRGIVLNDSKDKTQEAKSYNCVGKFNQFTYWNWNKPPTKSDPMIAALDWLKISSALHDPIED